MSDFKRQLNKKKIILSFLLISFLSVSCLIWYDLKFNESAIKNKMEILAQQIPLYFMPGFSQRVMYLASELALAAQELDFAGLELKESLEECNCKYTQSYCPSGGSINLVESLKNKILGSITPKVDQEMEELKLKIKQEITDVISEKKQEILDKVDSKIDEKLQKIQSDINETLAEIGQKEPAEINKKINEINSQIDKLNSEANSEIKKIETDAFEKVKEIESKAEEGIMKIREDISSEISEASFKVERIKLAKGIELQWEVDDKNEIIKGQVLGILAEEETEELEEELRLRIEKLNLKTNETISFVNERSRKIEDNINSLGDTITDKLGVFGDILKSISPCQPSPVGPFGSPCPKVVEKEIEKKQSEIKNKIAQISRLRQVLMEETKILKLDTDKELRNNLDVLLEESQKIIWFGEDLSNLYCDLNKCRARCSQGFGFDFMACLNPAEQKPITIKFEGGVSLRDLSLGNIIIENINLGLPKEIETPRLGELPSFKIDLGDLTINFPQVEVASVGVRTTVDISHQPIVFNTPSPPPVPQAPLLELGCPDFSSYNIPSYDLSSLPEKGEFESLGITESNWFLETFFWLREKCQGISNEINKNNVIFYEKALLPEICADLSYPCEAIEEVEENREDLKLISRREETTEATAEELAAAAEEAAAAAEEAAASADELAVVASEAAVRAEELAAAAEAAPEEEKAVAEAAAAEAAAEAAVAAEAAAAAAEEATIAAEIAFEAAAEAATAAEGQEAAAEVCLTDPCVQMKKDCKDARKKCDKDKSLFQSFISLFSDPCKKVEQECLKMSRDFLLSMPGVRCWDAAEVYTTIIERCDALWANYSVCKIIYRYNPAICELPAICQSLGSPEERAAAQKAQCKKLFQEQGEPVPANCNLALLQEKCAQLKEEHAELMEIEEEVEILPEIPEPCKFLPLFTGEFSIPEEYESPEYSTPYIPTFNSRKIFNFPTSLPGCPASPSTNLKISFPKVKIRDINLPSINLEFAGLSVFSIRLPSLKFEDLVLPDWELCNLNNCANMFPDFKFQLPYLEIPEIKIPPVDLGELNIPIAAGVMVNVPLPDVELSGIKYNVTPFKLSKLSNLGNLIAPEVKYNWPGIPRPRVFFKLSDIDLGIGFDEILGSLVKMVLAWFDIDISGCLHLNISKPMVGFHFDFDDILFSWPEFPELPEIPYCQDVNAFCANMKGELQQVSDQIGKIEETLNIELKEKIQVKLDTAALQINEELASIIQEQIEERVREIKDRIEDHIKNSLNYNIGICVGDYLPLKKEGETD